MGESATIGLRLAAGCLFGLLLALPVSDARAQFDPALPDGAGPPAQAAPVEELLDRLSAAEDESEARRLERIILRAWQNTESPTIEILFQRGSQPGALMIQRGVAAERGQHHRPNGHA